MEQRATVIKTDGKTAVVSVSRKTMCDGCSKADCDGSCTIGNMFGSSNEMQATALNEIGAEVGDTVEIESPTGFVLSAAAFVFMFPIVFAFAMYLVGHIITGDDGISLLFALGGFVLAFIVVGITEKINKNKKTKIVITKIVKPKSDEE